MADSPYELRKLVTVATFTFPWEAEVAKARLEAFGIHCLIADEHVVRMVALGNALGGIQVQVQEPDAQAALAVLDRPDPLPEIYLVTSPTRSNTAGTETGTERLSATADALVTVGRFSTAGEALVAQALLESEGVAACLSEERLPSLDLFSGAASLNRLEVHTADAPRALEILAAATTPPRRHHRED